MVRLWRSGVEADLVLIGVVSKEFQRYFNALTDDVKGKIHLLGPVDDAEKHDALDAASLLSMPSRTDSFGITYLEAWLYGIPVIAANTWGVTDVVDDKQNGMIVSFGEAESISAAVASILNNPVKAREMGERGREKVLQHYLRDQRVKEVESLYHRLLES
jgi:glycosyltransferase involved in cell wall biosynthesis